MLLSLCNSYEETDKEFCIIGEKAQYLVVASTDFDAGELLFALSKTERPGWTKALKVGARHLASILSFPGNHSLVVEHFILVGGIQISRLSTLLQSGGHGDRKFTPFGP